MTFAFGHILGGWTLGKIIEWKKKIKLSSYAWFFLLFGAILPDADYLIDWTFNTDFHRTFTHSLLFLIVAPLLLYFILHLWKHKEKAKLPLFLGVGIFSHLLLDILTSDHMGIPLLWPNLLHFSRTTITYINPATPSFLEGDASVLHYYLQLSIVDMALGTAWIFYLWWKKRIQF